MIIKHTKCCGGSLNTSSFDAVRMDEARKAVKAANAEEAKRVALRIQRRFWIG